MKRGLIIIALIVGTSVVSWAAGTSLTIVFGTPTVTCPDGNVSVDYTISTTAADGAIVTEKLTNSSNATVTQQSYTILAGNVAGGWTFPGGGRTKLHEGTYTYNGLSNGVYSLQVCVIQAGSGGNPDKTVCSSQTIVVDCAQIGNPCASTAPFGEVVGNTKINDHSTVQINFEGNLGESALVEISGDGFYRAAHINRNGDSCNYHANWKFTTGDGADFFGNNGPGVYAVTVSGNGVTFEFPVELN